MFLFLVNDVFEVPDRGIILSPGPGDKIVHSGSKIKLICPDLSIIETSIRGMAFEGNHAILVNLKKQDVPIGTEVWLENE